MGYGWSNGVGRCGLTVEQLRERESKRKRPRYYFPSDEIPVLWYHQILPAAAVPARHGRSNFYFENETIYSYGSHFPIARIAHNEKSEQAVLFTTKGYSPTTSGHKCAVRGAIPKDAIVFEVPEVREAHDIVQLKHYAFRVGVTIEKAAHAIKNYEWYIGEAYSLVAEAVRYADFFGEPLPNFPAIPPATPEAMKLLRRELKENAIRDRAVRVLSGRERANISD